MKKEKNKQQLGEPFILDGYVLPMLLEIMDNKDQVTMIHSSRVQRIIDIWIPELINEKIIKKEDIAKLWVSAILHDIGKIFVIDDILESKNKLNKKEYDHIRYHPLRGFHLAEQLDLPNEILMAIRHHHERWDGRTDSKTRFPGYPDGLKGEEIPLFARIIGIADACDAMISERHYKDTRPIEKTLQIIKNNAGTQFDPILAKNFVKQIKKNIKKEGSKLFK